MKYVECSNCSNKLSFDDQIFESIYCTSCGTQNWGYEFDEYYEEGKGGFIHIRSVMAESSIDEHSVDEQKKEPVDKPKPKLSFSFSRIKKWSLPKKIIIGLVLSYALFLIVEGWLYRDYEDIQRREQEARDLRMEQFMAKNSTNYKSNPCTDKEYIRLKRININNMTEREYEYYVRMSEKCIDEAEPNTYIYPPQQNVVVPVPGYTPPMPSTPPPPAASSVLERQIEGEFNGWSGETIVKMTNGEIWQQTEYYYQYRYSYRPKVLIINSGGWKMKVDGIDKNIRVKRLQ
jgi:hypothetical protein